MTCGERKASLNLLPEHPNKSTNPMHIKYQKNVSHGKQRHHGLQVGSHVNAVVNHKWHTKNAYFLVSVKAIGVPELLASLI